MQRVFEIAKYKQQSAELSALEQQYNTLTAALLLQMKRYFQSYNEQQAYEAGVQSLQALHLTALTLLQQSYCHAQQLLPHSNELHALIPYLFAFFTSLDSDLDSWIAQATTSDMLKVLIAAELCINTCTATREHRAAER